MRSLILVAALLGAGAHGAEVYKCTNAGGVPAFQDHPCAKGDEESKVHVAGTDATSAQVSAPNSVPPPPGPAVPPPRVPPRKSAPTMWVCERPEDGSHYMSRDGVTQPRMVPAGVLGIPGKSLAQAYGPGGIGVSAPGMRAIPIDRSPQAAVAGDYVAVQDQCAQASHEQVCSYLEQQYDQIHEKLKRAFKDEQAILQPQEDQLANDMAGC